MREILNISLPKETVQKIKKRAKAGGFESVSQYVKLMLEMDDDLISEDEILQMAAETEKEYREGKLPKNRSMADLIKKVK